MPNKMAPKTAIQTLPIHLTPKITNTNLNPKYRPPRIINFRKNRIYTPEERAIFVQNISQFRSPSGYKTYFSGENEKGISGTLVLYNLIQQQHKNGKPIIVPAGAIAEKLKVTTGEVSNAATLISTVLGYRNERKHSGALPAKESERKKILPVILEAHKKARNGQILNAEVLEREIIRKTGGIISPGLMRRCLDKLNANGKKKVYLHTPRKGMFSKNLGEIAQRFRRKGLPAKTLVQNRKLQNGTKAGMSNLSRTIK
ncbi:MAG: hypothetical protein NTY48_03365 [Candidatus Diapherotrites archaeon]|nr:hypothetical protein [Candidatus Diapherotrites archaeon]